MPTYETLAAFGRQWAKLDSAQRAAFRRAIAVFIADLKTGQGFSPNYGSTSSSTPRSGL